MVNFKHLLLAGLSFSKIIPRRIKAGEGRVQFDFFCNVTAVECSQAKKVLIASGESLDNVIEIKKPIVVFVKYYDFCKGNKTCWFGTVGTTSHNKMQLGGKYNDYFYPQALVKQLGPKEIKSGEYQKYDMVIKLNAGRKFQIVGKVKYTSNEVSLLRVVSHEILHGLGFYSSLHLLSLERNFIIPHHERNRKGHMSFIQSIFDSRLCIRATGKPLSSLIDKLNDLPKITRDQGLETLLQSPYIDTIKELSTILTTNGTVYFLTTNNNTVDIETGYKNYEPGSSVCHLDGAYVDKIESMMISLVTYGNGTDSITNYVGWYTAPYGPLTLEILATLGYTLKQPTWGHSLGGLVQLARQKKEKIRKKREIKLLSQPTR